MRLCSVEIRGGEEDGRVSMANELDPVAQAAIDRLRSMVTQAEEELLRAQVKLDTLQRSLGEAQQAACHLQKQREASR